MYPKTVIITVTTHGEIPLDEKGQPIKFVLPEGMSLTKISAVVPGVCNFLATEDAEHYVNTLIDWLKKKDESKFVEEKSKVSKNIVDFLKKEDMETFNQIDEDVREKKRKLKMRSSNYNDNDYNNDDDYNDDEEYSEEDSDDIKDDEEYLNQWNKSYQVTHFTNPFKRTRQDSLRPTRKELINKMYLRNNESEQFQQPWDFAITVLNVRGYPDLVREMTGRTHQDDSMITLEEITDFLNSKGVANIFLIDFSCSVFQPERDEVITVPDERTKRILRRELLKQQLHGGKLGDRKFNDRKLNDRKLNGRKLNDRKLNDYKLQKKSRITKKNYKKSKKGKKSKKSKNNKTKKRRV